MAALIFSTAISFILLFSVCTEAKFSVSEDNVISFNGIELLKHTTENPMLTLGYGTFEAIDSAGNFFLTDEVISKLPFSPEEPIYGK